MSIRGSLPRSARWRWARRRTSGSRSHTGFLTDPSKWEYTVPTWVFSSRELPRVDGPDIRFVSGDVAPVHEEMLRVADGRNIWLVGGGELVGQFHDQGLLDEVIIGMASVMLGSGAPLLPRRIVTPPLQLLDATAYGADFVMLRYAVRKDSAKPEQPQAVGHHEELS